MRLRPSARRIGTRMPSGSGVKGPRQSCRELPLRPRPSYSLIRTPLTKSAKSSSARTWAVASVAASTVTWVSA
jgi:hypothetical protein